MSSPWELGPSPEQLAELRRPFTPDAVRFKAQATFEGGGDVFAMVVTYIDARLVVERLNHVAPGQWEENYTGSGPDGTTWCELRVGGQRHRDVGEGRGKGLVSDALKRAAVRFGVGVSVYAAPKITLSRKDGQITAKQYTDSKGTKRWQARITDAGDNVCRERYAQWLLDTAEAAFGEPLDHGDVAESQGDVDVAPAPAEASEGEQAAAEVFDEAQVPQAVRRMVEIANAAYATLPADVRPLKGTHEQTMRALLRGENREEALQGYVDQLEDLRR